MEDPTERKREFAGREREEKKKWEKKERPHDKPELTQHPSHRGLKKRRI